MMKTITMLIAGLLCSIPAFQPALAETTPAAACLTANGQRLYNIRPFRNTPLPPGCRAGDTLVRFQLEQPNTIVRKLRNTLTAPAEQVLATLGGVRISQLFQGTAEDPLEERTDACTILVDIPGNALILGPDGADISFGGAEIPIGLGNSVVAFEFPGVIAGETGEVQIFLGDGSAVFLDDAVAITDFPPAPPDGCFAAVTARFARDARSFFGP